MQALICRVSATFSLLIAIQVIEFFLKINARTHAASTRISRWPSDASRAPRWVRAEAHDESAGILPGLPTSRCNCRSPELPCWEHAATRAMPRPGRREPAGVARSHRHRTWPRGFATRARPPGLGPAADLARLLTRRKPRAAVTPRARRQPRRRLHALWHLL